MYTRTHAITLVASLVFYLLGASPQATRADVIIDGFSATPANGTYDSLGNGTVFHDSDFTIVRSVSGNFKPGDRDLTFDQLTGVFRVEPTNVDPVAVKFQYTITSGGTFEDFYIAQSGRFRLFGFTFGANPFESDDTYDLSFNNGPVQIGDNSAPLFFASNGNSNQVTFDYSFSTVSAYIGDPYSFKAIPEPSSLLVVGALTVGLLMRRGKKNMNRR